MPGHFGDETFGSGTFGGFSVGPVGSGIVCTIEVAFADGPLDDPTAWTDISDFVRKLSTRRGRNHELGKTSAGVATITLDNRDRRFDPTNASGPYYPNVLPMRHIRISLTWALVPYPIFRGFVEDWGQNWGGPAANGKGDAFVEVQITDGFKVLELMQAMSYRDAVLMDQPALYFPMDDPLESVSGVNLGDGGDGADVLTYFPIPGAGSITPGARTDGPFASTADQVAVDFRNPTDAGAPAYLPAAEVTLQTAPLTIEFWIRPDTLSGTPNYIVAQAGDYWHVITSATGQVSFEYVANRTHGVGFTGVGSTANLTPAGETHHIAVVRDVDSIAFYQDGVFSQIYDGYADPVAIPGGAFGLNKIGSSFDGVLAHLAIYPTALSADQIATHYAAACEQIVEVPSGAAIDDILNCVGWPAGLRAIGTGASAVTVTPSGSALDVVQQIGEDTEHGIVEITPDGKFTFIDRNALHTLGASLATFGDGAGETPYRDLVLSYDDQDLWTEVIASSPEGTFTADDDTAVATYGRRTLSVSTVEATANATAAQASGLLNRYKAPAVRPTSITFMGSRSMTQQLSRAVGDRVTVKRRPPGAVSSSLMWVALATDSFNRANAALAGQSTETGGLIYVNESGTGSAISSNRFVSPSSAASLVIGVTDHAIEALPDATGGNHQLGVRYADINNRLGLLWNGLSLELYKVVASVSTTVATYTAAARGRTRLEVVGDAVRAYVGGVLVISYTITDAALRTGTKVLIFEFAGTGWWDDLLIDTWRTTVVPYGTLTVDALIEGINHDVGPDAWPTTTFALAPPDPAVFWLLGTSTLGVDTFPGW